METGIISKTYGSFYGVLSEKNLSKELRGSLRGRLRLRKKEEKKRRQRHLLAIGDRISFSFSNEGKDLLNVSIEELFPRENSLERFHHNKLHCLGANLSRAAVLVSLESPPPHFGFVDRFLCQAYLGNVKAWIIFTKRDLYEEKYKGCKKEDFFAFRLYKELGYKVFWLNLKDHEDLKEIKKEIYGGTTLLLGQSGVGKSTLLNHLLGERVQRTAFVSAATGQGRHTSTNASLFFHSPSQSFFIDTPGLREWGLGHMERQKILAAFSEIRPSMQKCDFLDCMHQPSSHNCAVEALLAASREFAGREEREKQSKVPLDLLHPSRLHSLESILASLSLKKGENRKLYR